MTTLAVMAACWVTRGAVAGYPISGAIGGLVMGQVTSQASLSWGAAKSEPSGHLAAAAPCLTGVRQ